MADKQLLNIKEVAEIFNISVATIYRLIDGRKIPFYKIGGSIRFSIDDINKYLEENRVEQMSKRKY